MKQYILLISFLSTCYSKDSSLCRLDGITWSLPPKGPYGFIEAEYIAAPEIEGEIRWFKEATQRRPEADNGPLSDDIAATSSRSDGRQEYPYDVWIFNNRKHDITASKWQDGDGVHHSSRINFAPVPLEFAEFSVAFSGSGLSHSVWMNDVFNPNASESGRIPGSMVLLKKPRNYLRVSGGEVKLHTSVWAKGPLEAKWVIKHENVTSYTPVDESNIEVEDYTCGGMFFRSVDVVLPYTSDIEGEYMSMISQSTETVYIVSQVLPDDPRIESLYQTNNTMLQVRTCNPMSMGLQEEGILYLHLNVGWENCIYCEVFGYPNPTVQMFRNGNPLNVSLGPNESIATFKHLHDKVQITLSMEPVDESVAGRYKCVGKAEGSEEVSQEFIVEMESAA